MTDVDLEAEKARMNELLDAFERAVSDRLPMHTGTIFLAALNLLSKAISKYGDEAHAMAQAAIRELQRTFPDETQP